MKMEISEPSALRVRGPVIFLLSGHLVLGQMDVVFAQEHDYHAPGCFSLTLLSKCRHLKPVAGTLEPAWVSVDTDCRSPVCVAHRGGAGGVGIMEQAQPLRINTHAT